MATGNNMEHKLALAKFYEQSQGDRLELSKLAIRQGSIIPDVVKSFGLSTAMSLMALLIQKFCNQFNVRYNMTPGQIVDLAADLVVDFNNRKGNQVRLEELAIFFDRAAKNEFTKKNGASFVFDHIDRAVIEEMMDVYFETDRTAAVWAIEDEKRISPQGEIIPRVTPPMELDKYGNDITPKNIYDLAGNGEIAKTKFFQQLKEKYGQ